MSSIKMGNEVMLKPRDVVAPMDPERLGQGFERGRHYEVEKAYKYGSDWSSCGVFQKIKIKDIEGLFNPEDFVVGEIYDPEFKEGQLVRCIDDYGSETLHQGHLYTVEKRKVSNTNSPRDHLVKVGGNSPTYGACRFEVVNLSELTFDDARPESPPISREAWLQMFKQIIIDYHYMSEEEAEEIIGGGFTTPDAPAEPSRANFGEPQKIKMVRRMARHTIAIEAGGMSICIEGGQDLDIEALFEAIEKTHHIDNYNVDVEYLESYERTTSDSNS